MNKKKKAAKTVGFLVKLLIVLVAIAGIGVGGFFIIDKAIIPSYFGKYGIDGLGDLVEMIKVLHSSPNEKEFITHAYTESDEVSATTKLKDAGIPVENGKINFGKIVDGEYVITDEAKQGVFVSDYEMAAVLGQMLESGYLVSYLKDLSYLDTLSFSAKQIEITPISDVEEDEDGLLVTKKAHISLVVKLDTTNAQKHMAKEMDVPEFLLNLIMPNKLYITSTYDVSILEGDEYEVTNASLGINGRSPKQSEVLLNILTSFIFPKEDEMTPEKLSTKFGDIVNSGLKILGDVEFCTQKTANGTENGIYVKVDPHIETEEPADPGATEDPGASQEEPDENL